MWQHDPFLLALFRSIHIPSTSSRSTSKALQMAVNQQHQQSSPWFVPRQHQQDPPLVPGRRESDGCNNRRTGPVHTMVETVHAWNQMYLIKYFNGGLAWSAHPGQQEWFHLQGHCNHHEFEEDRRVFELVLPPELWFQPIASPARSITVGFWSPYIGN